MPYVKSRNILEARVMTRMPVAKLYVIFDDTVIEIVDADTGVLSESLFLS